MFVELKPRAERAPIGDVINRLRRSLAKVEGIRASPTPVQNLRIWRTRRQFLLPIHADGDRSGDAERHRSALHRAAAADPRLRRRIERPAVRRLADRHRRRSRGGRPAGRAARPHPLHSVPGVRLAHRRQRVHRFQRLRGDPRGRPGTADRAGSGVAHPRPFGDRRVHSARQSRQGKARSRPNFGVAAGAIAVGHRLVRPRAGDRASARR